MNHSEYLLTLQDDLRSYLNGTMESEKKKTFEALLQTDQDLMGEFQRHRCLDLIRRSNTMLKAQPDIRQILKEPIEPDFRQYDELHSDKPARRYFSGKLIAGAAIGVILLLIGGAIWRHSAQQTEYLQELADPFMKPYQNIVHFNQQHSDEAYPRAMEEYENGRYPQTVKLLNEYLRSNNNENAFFYTGMSLGMIKKYRQAISPFKSAAQSKSFIAPVAKWYLALSYLELGEAKEAAALLKELENDDSHGADARLLLQKLKGI